MAKALAEINPLLREFDRLDEELVGAMDWMAKHDENMRNEYRRRITRNIIDAGKQFWDSGEVAKWLDGCDDFTRRVLLTFNGPLLELLARKISYGDPSVIGMMRGAPLVGQLATSGRGKQKIWKPTESVHELWRTRRASNAKIVSTLSDSKFEKELLDQTRDDAKLGRISEPTVYHDSEKIGRVSRRFAVEQNGSVRLVDDATKSGVNPCGFANEKLSEHRLGVWFQMVKRLTGMGFGDLFSAKLDVKAAFKRVPILPCHRWIAEVVFRAFGVDWHCCHYAMPFGYLAAVYSWERLSILLWCILVRLLFLPCGKYVDDYYLVESAACVEVALECAADVMRAILGEQSLSPSKIAWGNPLNLLGFSVQAFPTFAKFELSEDKRLKWLCSINEALESGVLSSNQAAQLGGRLAFAGTFLFRRLGRAMLRPLFAQQHKPTHGGIINRQMRMALAWWSRALSERCCEEFSFETLDTVQAELFVDAASTPGVVAAVLVIGDASFFAFSAVPKEWDDFWVHRRDNQIMGLELLSILFGLHAFADVLGGRTIRIWSDNHAGCHAVIRGGSKQPDHNQLVHRIWSFCFDHKVSPWLSTVPSDDNVADGPTRGDYAVLASLGSKLITAQVPSVCW